MQIPPKMNGCVSQLPSNWPKRRSPASCSQSSRCLRGLNGEQRKQLHFFHPTHNTTFRFGWVLLKLLTICTVQQDYASMHGMFLYFKVSIFDIAYIRVLLSSLLVFLSHLAKLLSSHDASKGARAPKAWKSAVLTKSYGKKHGNPGCLKIPGTGDTLQKPWMNKQNMNEHVESGFRVWSFQKDTSLSAKVKVLKGQSDNPMQQNVPVHLQQNRTLSLEHRHSTSTTSRCEEHGLHSKTTKAARPATQ